MAISALEISPEWSYGGVPMIINITGLPDCGRGRDRQLYLLQTYLESQGKSVYRSQAYRKIEEEQFGAFLNRRRIESPLVMYAFEMMCTSQRKWAEKALARNQIVLTNGWDDFLKIQRFRKDVTPESPHIHAKRLQRVFDGIKANITFLLNMPATHDLERTSFLNRLAQLGDWIVLDARRSEEALHKDIVFKVERELKCVRK